MGHFKPPSFAGKNPLRMNTEERRRSTLKMAAAQANEKFSHGGKANSRAPVTLVTVPSPRAEHQDVDVVTRHCGACNSSASVRVENAVAGREKKWLKSTCTNCGRTWGPKC